MKKIKYGPLAISPGLMAVSAICTLGLYSPAAAIPGDVDIAQDQMSVRELIRLDTEQALSQARDRAGTKPLISDRPSRVSRAMAGEPRLNAIYGVGPNLMAEVVLDQNTYLYRQGQALPVGVAAGEDVYVLQHISSSCIDLKRSSASHHLCLRQTKWTDK